MVGKVLSVQTDRLQDIFTGVGALRDGLNHRLARRRQTAGGAGQALEGYAQYPGSDCLIGGVIRVPDGRRLMEKLSSHHYLLMTGHHAAALKLVGKVFGLEIELGK